MKIVPLDDYSTVHFCRHNLASQNTAADRNATGKGVLLTCDQQTVTQKRFASKLW